MDTRERLPEQEVGELDRAAEALFQEARERARRRRRRAAAALGAVLLIGVAATAAALDQGGDRTPSGPPRAAAIRVKPRQLLDRAPYMGVSCSMPNSVACDRVGLAVWLKRPARAVAATIGRRSFWLVYEGCCFPQRPAKSPRRLFMGFLDHAGLRGTGPLAVRVENGHDLYTGRSPVAPRVRLVVTAPNGVRRATTTRVLLAPGWG